MHQLGWIPSDTDQQAVETARKKLAILFHELKNAMNIAGVVEINGLSHPTQEPLAIWGDIVDEVVPSGPSTMPTVEAIPAPSISSPSSSSIIQIEDQLVPLPSNNNVAQGYSQLELSHHISHADHHLNQIQDLIAEKSFQYSHVIRVSPHKGVNTNSRGTVKMLNLEISIYCRMYTHCQSCLQALGAEPAILRRFQKLTTEDVKASTAIVNLNVPGSTQIKLS